MRGSFAQSPTALFVSNTSWVRPANWMNYPTITGQYFMACVAVYPNYSNTIALTVPEDFTIDWGDGLGPTNYVGGTLVEKSYNFNTLTSPITNDGYRTAVIVITPNNGTSISTVNLNEPTSISQPNLAAYLELVVNLPLLSSFPLIEGFTSLQSFVGENIGTLTSFGFLFVNSTIVNLAVDINTISDGSAAFANCKNLKHVNFRNYGHLQSCYYMFNGCSSMEIAPTINTTSVTNMEGMFINCSNLKYIPLYDTSNVTNIVSFAANCVVLFTLPFFNFSNVLIAESAFSSCTSLITIPAFNLSNATDVRNMFAGCVQLSTVPSLNLSSATLMSGMFSYCTSLYSIGTLTTPAATNMNQLFQSCSSLEDAPAMDTANVTTMSSIFTSCVNLKTVPLYNTVKVLNFNSAFSGCTSLVTAPAFNTSVCTTFSSMFANCTSLRIVPALDLNLATTIGNSIIFGSPAIIKFNPINIKKSIDVSGKHLTVAELNEIQFRLVQTTSEVETFKYINTFHNMESITGTINATSGSDIITFTSPREIPIGYSMVHTTGVADNTLLSFASNTFTWNNHKFTEGTTIYLLVVTGMVGVTTRLTYSVINVTANTFQLGRRGSLVSGTNGTARLRYQNDVVERISSTQYRLRFATRAYTNFNIAMVSYYPTSALTLGFMPIG